MKILKIIPILVFVLLTVSCSSVKVVVDETQNVDFSKYKTYSLLSWQELDDELFGESDKKMLTDAFVSEFERRGLKLVPSAGDMQVSLYVVLNSESAFSGYNDYVGGRGSDYSHYIGGWGYGYNGNTSKQQSKLVGTLIMNVYDGGKHNQIWQAIATSAVNENYKTRDKSIPGKVSTIMKRFPVQPK